MPDVAEIAKAAALVGAIPADIPGLWFAPNYPELTTNQLLQIARAYLENSRVTD